MNEKITPLPVEEFCCECDTPLEMREVDDHPHVVCMNCQRITRGYQAHSKELAHRIRNWLSDGHKWMTTSLLMIALRWHEENTSALTARVKELEEALDKMLDHPLVIPTDDALDVASWFVQQARAALNKGGQS